LSKSRRGDLGACFSNSGKRLKTLVAITMLLASGPAAAGVVQTFDARLEGDVTFADGRLDVAGKAAPWNTVIYALPQTSARTLSAAGAVRLAGGEVWRAEILTLSNKRLAVRSALLGAREIDLGLVSQLEFTAARAASPAPADDAQDPAAGTLYREKGEPVPGTLLWVDETHLALDSPLGVLTLPREGLVRYKFPDRARAAPAGGGDRVGLIDGSVISGAAKPVAGGVQIEHPILGTMKFAAGLIQYVRRGDARVADLVAGVPASMTTSGVFEKAAAAKPILVSYQGGAKTEKMQHLAAERLEPKTVVRYELRQEAGKKVRLTGRASPIEGGRGDAVLRISAGGKTLFERTIAPGAATVPLAVDLPEAKELVLEVDFGPRIAFPCGVLLEDPLLITAP
jgi:hypothetical protein